MLIKDLKYYQDLMVSISIELDSIKEDILLCKRPDEIYDLQKDLELGIDAYKEVCEDIIELIVADKVVDLENYRQIRFMMKMHGI